MVKALGFEGIPLVAQAPVAAPFPERRGGDRGGRGRNVVGMGRRS